MTEHAHAVVEPSEAFEGGTGPRLVLLHGLTMSWRAWTPVLPELVRHCAVYAPTLPGHRGGRQIEAGTRVGVDRMVDLLCRQLDEAGIDTAHVAGNSLGGWIALELARRGRAESVVALSPAGAWATSREMRRLVALFRIGIAVSGRSSVRRLAENPRLRRHLLRQVSEHAERLSPAETAGLFEDMAGCTVIDDLLRRTVVDGPMRVFSTLPCPVRIAWGERDRTIPYRGYGRPMLDAVPGAELVALPGVGHVPMIDDPGLVARTILRGVGSAGTT